MEAFVIWATLLLWAAAAMGQQPAIDGIQCWMRPGGESNCIGKLPQADSGTPPQGRLWSCNADGHCALMDEEPQNPVLFTPKPPTVEVSEPVWKTERRPAKSALDVSNAIVPYCDDAGFMLDADLQTCIRKVPDCSRKTDFLLQNAAGQWKCVRFGLTETSSPAQR